ncbi:maker695 [Drosophila busckii]|uniref:Maker695 n=1 Tax=Drosophila busckii TaxID=30019 RepID=A0A0M4EKR7_DROBS|nr:neuropeptide-like 4 [Drosophila busckii]ALC43897.1 maker695 [Drosophila busckii]
MFKFFALCLFAVVALAAAKPQFLATSYAAAPVVAASPYAAYTSGVYAAPYAAAYTNGYYASPYAAYSAYPYSSLYYRR